MGLNSIAPLFLFSLVDAKQINSLLEPDTVSLTFCTLVGVKMVRIQVKHGCRGRHNKDEENSELEFLYDCETSCTTIEDVTKEITEIANFQLKIHQLGIQLLPRLSILLYTNPPVISFHRAVSESTSYVSKDQVVHGKPLSSIVLREHMRNIETEFAVNYHLLDFPDAELEPLLSDVELLQEDSVQLLWAGKEFTKGKMLRDYIGNNEKTKIILRLLPRNSHPTPRDGSSE